MRYGTIVRVDIYGGFGFICEFGEYDAKVFFHQSVLDGLVFDETLIERRVCFEAVEKPKGLRATFVRPNDGADHG